MESRSSHLGIGIALGLAIGAGLGVAMDNLAVGMGAGVAIGIAIGLAMDESRKRKGGSGDDASKWDGGDHRHDADGGSDGGGD